MGVGLALKKVLRDRKMTIKQLSESSGISVNTLYSITKRDSERVDNVILDRIASVLGVSTDYLLGKSEESSQPENQSDDFSTHLIEITKDLSEADRQLVLGMARRLRDTGESGVVMTSNGPHYLYNYQDRTGTPTAPAPAGPEGKDTPAAEPAPETADRGSPKQ